jgi:glucose/arabinose dehydrogenase
MISHLKKLVGALLAVSAVFATAAVAAGPPPPTATSGKPITQVAAGLGTPTSFAFGGGNVFEGDGGNSKSGPPNGGVFLLKGGTGTKIAGSPNFVGGLAWYKGALYVSAGTVTAKGPKWQLLKWSGWNGSAFTKQQAIYTAPKKLDGLNGLAFGPDGRLYVGVDVGLTDGNDHGPAKTPYVYSILSINPNGKDLKVFATGIRQPWQFAFTKGSASPLVSDLGQDSGAKNPPDFLLRVSKGQNYGFPQCNRTTASKCKGFAKPLKLFPPHTDIMGLAIIGSRLYMTSFTGPGGKGPGGEVLSMPLTGGAVTPVVTGFVAPTVGLGVDGGTLYIGELTGQVFSLTP